MTAPMFAALLLHTLTAMAVADGPSYTKHMASNAYRNHFGWYGGEHLDHCERSGSTLQECQDWCSQDCECHCLTVYEPNGACQRRHSCDASEFDDTADSADFAVYVKDPHTSDCSKFQDLGMHTTCQGTDLQDSTATNVGSLEKCKSLCVMLSFECKGVQYTSNCVDKTLDQCKIITAGTIDSQAETVAPEADGSINSHCLKYTGPVGDASDSLLVPLTMTMTGIDGAALVADPAAVNSVGTAVKTAVADQSASIEPEDVTVELRAGSLIADIQVRAESTQDFVGISQALTSTQLKSLVVGALGDLPEVQDFRDSNTLEIAEMLLSQPNLVTATDTTTSTATTGNITTTETLTATTENITVNGCSGFHLRLCVLGTMLMRFIIA